MSHHRHAACMHNVLLLHCKHGVDVQIEDCPKCDSFWEEVSHDARTNASGFDVAFTTSTSMPSHDAP